MNSNPLTLFLKQFRADFLHMGAISPSSRSAARAMVAYLSKKQGPVRVLEAGAGTGAFTGEIISCLQPGDTFDIVEINPELFAFLQQKFGPGSAASASGVQLHWINGDIREISPQPTYDYIVFSLPLTNFPPQMVQEILSLMVDSLKPGGVFSYIKYIFISRFKYAFGGSAIRAEMDANHAIIDAFTNRYQIERKAVWPNMPPAWIYYWQKK